MSRIIVIDAGHGLGTAGKRCLKSLDPSQTREWYLNDRIADRLQELLAGYDCTVIRADDTTGQKDVSLSARVATANSAGADIYVSIHHNAGLNGRSGGGTVAYYYNSRTQADMALRLYNAVVARTGLRGNRSQRVIRNGFYVIKNTSMPAVLLENGFMDSPDDVPVILSAGHAEKTAQGLLDFLTAELSLRKKSTAPEPLAGSGSGRYVYTVASGDTLTKIAKSFGVTWQSIASANGIGSPYTIRIGQMLVIPGAVQASACYPAYTGQKTTLASALASIGVNSSYGFRREIARANGISGYVGTASQNTMMYNLLVAGALKRVV